MLNYIVAGVFALAAVYAMTKGDRILATVMLLVAVSLALIVAIGL